MARIRIFTGTGPERFEQDGIVLWLCACGLSKTFPVCDGSHVHTRGEDECKVYCYADDFSRSEVSILSLVDAQPRQCCSGTCACKDNE